MDHSCHSHPSHVLWEGSIIPTKMKILTKHYKHYNGTVIRENVFSMFFYFIGFELKFKFQQPINMVYNIFYLEK